MICIELFNRKRFSWGNFQLRKSKLPDLSHHNNFLGYIELVIKITNTLNYIVNKFNDFLKYSHAKLLYFDANTDSNNDNNNFFFFFL